MHALRSTGLAQDLVGLPWMSIETDSVVTSGIEAAEEKNEKTRLKDLTLVGQGVSMCAEVG